eukprot:522126-Amorphochlora_amoeboformis.AAC.1
MLKPRCEQSMLHLASESFTSCYRGIPTYQGKLVITSWKILPSPVVDDNVPTPFPDTTVLCDGSLEPVGTAPALRGSCPADRADGDGPDMKSKLRGEFKCGTSRALVPEGKRPPVKSLKFSKSFNGYSVGDQKDEGRKEWPLLKYWKKIEVAVHNVRCGFHGSELINLGQKFNSTNPERGDKTEAKTNALLSSACKSEEQVQELPPTQVYH